MGRRIIPVKNAPSMITQPEDTAPKGTAAVCTDPGCGPETAWVEEGVSWFRGDGRGWYRSGV